MTSEAEEQPKPSLIPITEEELRQQDLIISQPISQRRKDEFFEKYTHDREQAAATEAIFQRCSAFRQESDWQDSCAYGFNTLLMKGPFVERSNWFSYQPWELALAAERRLLSRLMDALSPATQQLRSTAVPHAWPNLLDAADQLIAQLPEGNRLARSIIVIAGPLRTTYDREVESRVTPRWELPKELDRAWILGLYRGRPLLHIREAERPALYAVDIPRLGVLVRHDSLQFELIAIDVKRANELLDLYPEYVSVQPGRPDTREERLRELQLRVQLRLYESCEIEARQRERAAFSLPIEPINDGGVE